MLSAVTPDAGGFAAKWMAFIDQAGKDSAPQRARASLVIRLLMHHLQDALRTSLGSAAGDPRAAQLGTRAGPEGVLDRLEACNHADYLIERKVQLVLVVESLADKLCRA